jgi:hypothetical protein
LAQVAGTANVAHLAGNLQSGFSGRLDRMNANDNRTRRRKVLNVEGFMTFSAKGVNGPVLHQFAVVTAHYFT